MAALALLAGLGVPAPAAALEVSFRLVPAELWDDQKLPGDGSISGGQVFLYRVGDYVPSLVVPAGQPTEIPAGTWRWIAEAPGYVTIDSGTISVALEGESEARTIVWPVVRACEIELAASASWGPVQRLDVVSTRYGSVYPVDPKRRRSHLPGSDGIDLAAYRPGELIEVVVDFE